MSIYYKWHTELTKIPLLKDSPHKQSNVIAGAVFFKTNSSIRIQIHFKGSNYYGIKRLVLFDGSADAPWATGACDADIKSLVEAHMQAYQSPSATVFDLLQNLPLQAILEIQQNLSRLGLVRCFSPLPRKQGMINEELTLFNRVSLLYGQTEFAGAHFIRNKITDDADIQLLRGITHLLEGIFRISAYPLANLLNYIYMQLDGGNEKSKKRKKRVGQEEFNLMLTSQLTSSVTNSLNEWEYKHCSCFFIFDFALRQQHINGDLYKLRWLN